MSYNTNLHVLKIDPLIIGCRHLHIPLQAGSDEVLQSMARKYTMKEFREFLSWAHDTVPGLCIATNIIIGYPDETKAQFDQTIVNILTLPLHYIYVFSYSERKLARSRKKESIDAKIIKEQSKTLPKFILVRKVRGIIPTLKFIFFILVRGKKVRVIIPTSVCRVSRICHLSAVVEGSPGL